MSQLMGAAEVQSLVGKWQAIVGDAVAITPGRRDIRDRQRGWDGDRGWNRGYRDEAPQETVVRDHRGFVPQIPFAGRHAGPMHRHEWERLHPGQSWHERERKRLRWERLHPGVPFVGVEAITGAWYSVMGRDAGGAQQLVGQSLAQELGVPPRNLLVEQPPPQFARREALPLNSGTVTVGFNGTLQITSRPQRPAYRPERFFVAPPIGGVGPAGGPTGDTAAAWIINDVTIGNKSQFAQSGQLPGDMFSSTAIDSFVSFDTVQTAMDVVVIATYVGASTVPVAFIGGMLGTSAVHC